MSFNPASPVTGAAITGLTTPTYTLISDTPPANNAKQWYVSALGGTQTGIDIHSVGKPFTLSVFRPIQLKAIPNKNPITGAIKNIPNNVYKIITRKGASPAVNLNPSVPRIFTTIEIPAGCETYEPEELKAMISLHIGAMSAQSSGIFDLVATGSI